MPLEDDIAKIAGLIGDKTRAKILTALMAGKALTAGELALLATTTPQSASGHLNKLLQAKLIVCKCAGRHRYYKLASHRVAKAIESLGLLSDTPSTSLPKHKQLPQEIKQARTCYDHLAGKLGVCILQGLQAKKYIQLQGKNYNLTTKGQDFFEGLSIDIENLSKLRRSFARPCLDWTEREYHLAGSLGKAILDYFIEQRLVIRGKRQPRVLTLTTKGIQWLKQELSIAL